jgi:transposase InsO family protein
VESFPKLIEVVNISKSSLYYKSKMEVRDAKTKLEIEKVLSEFPSYGHRRIALHLKQNRKAILRVMNKFGIKPYRRKRKPWKRANTEEEQDLQNLIKDIIIYKANQVWVTDFTYIWFKTRFIYLATVMDRYTREILGTCVLVHHNTSLVLQALTSALMNNSKPEILHQDQGSEYTAKVFQEFSVSSGIKLSFSKKGSPWENAFQESFYDKFKIDFGDANRFETLGELVYEIHKQIYIYNHKRIHLALKMSPVEFAKKSLPHYDSAI